MALTELQKRKLQVAFESYDFDGDGALEKEDLERVASQTSKIQDLKSGTPGKKKVESVVTIGWDELQGIADADSSGEVTLDEWYVFFDGVINNPNKFEQYIQAAASRMIPYLDSDGDGKISLEDYKEFILSFNLGKGDAETAFKKLDTDNDGDITHEELKERIREFYLSDDENAAGNWFLGRF